MGSSLERNEGDQHETRMAKEDEERNRKRGLFESNLIDNAVVLLCMKTLKAKPQE